MPNHASGVSRPATIGPGSRLAGSRMALKRCVNPVRPSASAALVRAGCRGVPERDADAGLGECAMNPSGTCSGASVTSITPARRAVSCSASRAVGRRNVAGSCARLLGRQERSFQVDAENARIGGNDCCAASSAGAHLGRRVADQSWERCRRSEVPMRRTMAAIPSGVGLR